MLNNHLKYIRQLVEKGGIEIEEYQEFDDWVANVVQQHVNGDLSMDDVDSIRNAFGDALSPNTMQGFALTKPHGYAGDYEMLDRIYQKHIAKESHLRKWDEYFHLGAAPNAVRNRKSYFLTILDMLESNRGLMQKSRVDVLNVASGSGRDLYEFFSSTPNAELYFDCIDQDTHAIAFAKSLCNPWLHRIRFHHQNALKFSTDKKYDLVWSAGLFDYFDDKAFMFLLKRYYGLLARGRELVIGNFSEKNPSRKYMELIGNWVLHHRNVTKLMSLAEECGIHSSKVHVGSEPLGVNLFLHVKK